MLSATRGFEGGRERNRGEAEKGIDQKTDGGVKGEEEDVEEDETEEGDETEERDETEEEYDDEEEGIKSSFPANFSGQSGNRSGVDSPDNPAFPFSRQSTRFSGNQIFFNTRLSSHSSTCSFFSSSASLSTSFTCSFIHLLFLILLFLLTISSSSSDSSSSSSSSPSSSSFSSA